MGKTAFGLFVLAAFATPALGQSFLGQWTATAHTPGADVHETLNVTRTADGYAVAAKAIGVPEGTVEAGPGEKVMLDGNNFSYERSLVIQGGSIVISYAGVVSGDTFEGTAKLGETSVAYTGVRAGK
jgi:hypothetical protein